MGAGVAAFLKRTADILANPALCAGFARLAGIVGKVLAGVGPLRALAQFRSRAAIRHLRNAVAGRPTV